MSSSICIFNYCCRSSYWSFAHCSAGRCCCTLAQIMWWKGSLLSGHRWAWSQGTDALPCINTLRPRQNGRLFPDDIFKWIFLNENIWISLRISLKFVPRVRINNIPALVQIMAWRRPGDKPLSEPMMAGLLTHICVTRLQWVNQGLAETCFSLQ